MSNDHVHPIFQGILAAIAPASAASNNHPASNNSPASIAPQTLSEVPAEQWGERFMGSQAFQEGQDAALLGQALNPYRPALRGVLGPTARAAIEELAHQWEDGYVSKAR